MKKLILISIFLILISVGFVQAEIIPPPSLENSGINIIHTPKNTRDCEDTDCSYKNKCYPHGFIMEGKFCAYDYDVRDDYGRLKYPSVTRFVEQLELGKNCSNNFECLTNMCLDNLCANITEEINYQVDIKIEELKQEMEDEEDLNESNNLISGSVVEENSEIPVKKNLFEKIFDWFKKLFKKNN